jgi:hypothetical protein
MTTVHTCVLSLAFLVAACGGGGTPGDDVPGDDVPGDDTQDPVLVPGGGVTGAAIDGVVNVYVIDQSTGAPIAGAAVTIGAAAAVTTDADGLAVLEDAAVTGAQTITATAAGHVAATWVGVPGTSATIPLEPTATPQARVTGTIAGWDGLDDPPIGNYNLAVVLYSLSDDVGAPENHLAQPMNGATPANTCIKSFGSEPPCAWQMNARVGQQIHFAVIVEGDPQGTNNDISDDTYELIGYAVGASVTLTAGQQMMNESLTITSAARSPLTVGFPAAPGGLGELIAIPMLDLGADGRIVFPLPQVTPGSTSVEVLSPTGPFAGSYDVVGLATPPGVATVPYATGFARGATVGGTTQLPAWQTVPTVSATGGVFSASGTDDAELHSAVFTRGTTRLWNVSVLDGSTGFSLPTLPTSPLGTGPVTVEIAAGDLPSFDPGHFQVKDLATALSRASGASTTFTP